MRVVGASVRMELAFLSAEDADAHVIDATKIALGLLQTYMFHISWLNTKSAQRHSGTASRKMSMGSCMLRA